MIETENREKFQISALVVPQIAAALQNHSCQSVGDIPHLGGLKLAHPVTSDENLEISLLIGVDYYWDFVQNEIIRGEGPTAMKSKLGYLLSAPLKQSDRGSTSVSVNAYHIMATTREDDYHLENLWSAETVGTLPKDDINPD